MPIKKYPIVQQFLTPNSKRRSGLLLTLPPVFIVAHDTGNPGSTAAGNVRYYENSHNEVSASAHLFVDDKQIIECIPALTTDKPEKAWHVLYNVDEDNKLFGCDANDAAIGVEYCYGGTINADEAYHRYLWTIAYACAIYNINPSTNVIGHHFLDPLRKTDPVTGLLQSRRSYEQLLRDVVGEFNEITGSSQKPNPSVIFQTGLATVTVRLNVRANNPSTRSRIVNILHSGQQVSYVGWDTNGESVNGNAKWFKTAEGDWFWSGGVK